MSAAHGTPSTGESGSRVFLGFGSNLGDSAATILLAWQELKEWPEVEVVALSSPYVTAPVDMQSHHWFTNAVGEIRTSLAPDQLLARLLGLELSLGRDRKRDSFGYQDRVIDIDILYYGEKQRNDPDLVLPHPHLQKRLFVLAPLVEVAPDFVDGKRGATVQELLERLKARLAAGEIREQDISRSSWPNGVATT